MLEKGVNKIQISAREAGIVLQRFGFVSYR